MEVAVTVFSRRLICVSAVLAGLLPSASLWAADNPKEIYVDWATYNPVSMLLKDKGFLEKEFAKDGIKVVWVKTVSSSNALQFLNADSINFGSTAGSAALVAKINGNPDQVGLRLFAAGMDRARHHQGQQDQQGRGPQGQEGRDGARHRSAHLRGAGAARRRPHRQGHHARCWCSSTPTAAPR